MLLYNPDCGMALSDFGIGIPIRFDKPEMVYRALKEGPLAGYPEESWRRRPSCTGITREDLVRVHSLSYVDRLFDPRTVDKEILRTFELIDEKGNYNRYDPTKAKRPLADLVKRSLGSCQGVYEGGRTALETGFAFVLAGGAHHAMRDFGAGFCVTNDVVVPLRKLQAEGRIGTVWVIDVDAHKGDGTAALTYGDDTIRTLSIHMAKGWPLDAPEYDVSGRYNPSYTPSDIDIGIEEGEDARYVPELKLGLEKLLAFPKPDLVLVVDGSDPYEKDELPSTKPLSLSLETMLERDLLLYEFLSGRGIPSVWIMAGGYGRHSWEVYVNFLGRILPERLERRL